MAFLLTACAPQEQAFAPRERPAQLAEGKFIAGDGVELPLRHWRVEKGKVRAIILALHGFNDYSNAFAMPAEYFAARGIETYAYDQRGFGASPQKGIWANAQNLTEDLRQIAATLRERHPHVPFYLLGESMGGAVVATAMRQPDAPKADGIILSAPAVWGGEDFNAFFRATLWMAAHIAPGKLLTGQGLKVQASDNIPMLVKLGQDPLVIKATRLDAIYNLVQLMDAAHHSAEHLRAPTLLLYGRHDQIIPAPPVYDFASRLQAPHVFAVYPTGWHMLMRDLCAQIVWEDIAHWVLHHDAPLPSGMEQNRQEVGR